jgi:hypothetical protein
MSCLDQNRIQHIELFSDKSHDLVSISPTFYEQLLCTQVPKAQKTLMTLLSFAHLGSVSIKAARKTLVKLIKDEERRYETLLMQTTTWRSFLFVNRYCCFYILL